MWPHSASAPLLDSDPSKKAVYIGHTPTWRQAGVQKCVRIGWEIRSYTCLVSSLRLQSDSLPAAGNAIVQRPSDMALF